MAKKLFVGGLAYAITSDDLKELFSGIGEVESAQVIMDRETNRSKGFGFVEMVSDDDANKAVNELNGKDVSGRSIVVNEARPKENRERRPFNNDFRGNDRRDNRY